MKQKWKGSVTIFLSLILMIVCSLVFALLEASRVGVLRQRYDIVSRAAMESAFAGYHKRLWEEYGLMLAEKERMEEDMRESIGYAAVNSHTLNEGELSEIDMVKCQQAMDDEGSAYVSQVCELMKYVIPVQAAEKIYQKISGGGSYFDRAEETEIIDMANEACSQEGRLKKKAREQETENPIEEMKRLKAEPVLSLVLPAGAEISSGSMREEQQAANRQIETGNWEQQKKPGWYEKTMFLLFQQNYFSCYTKVREGRAMSYETEYLIGGKSSDRENLEKTVEKLLLLRETVNYSKKAADPVISGKAEALALAIAGVTGVPAIINALKNGILLAWAFMDSIDDVRILLDGGKIELYAGTALDYSEYLNVILMTMRTKVCFYRGADIMGNEIGINFDKLVQQAEVVYSYEGSPFFARLVTIVRQTNKGYRFCYTLSESYLEK